MMKEIIINKLIELFFIVLAVLVIFLIFYLIIRDIFKTSSPIKIKYERWPVKRWPLDDD
jgi:hypothetical protein